MIHLVKFILKDIIESVISMSDSDSDSDNEKATSDEQNKPSLSKGFTIPKGPSLKPPPTNINKQIVSNNPIPPISPSKSEESRKRPISKRESFVPSVWSSAYDKELPQEVLSKCRENKCDICNATLISPETARSHYDAKPHEKKVQQFMEKMFKDSGEAPPKRIRTWETGPTFNKGSAEVDNVVAAAPASSNTLAGYKHKSFQRRWLTLWDGDLPRELVDMCVASRCGLCEVDMSSLNVATSHYEGKPHAKRVKEFCTKVGARIPFRKDEEREMTEKFCELCKVTFTSASMAKGHYNGKEHKRREISGKEKIKVVEDKTGRFGIGGNFRTDSGYKPPGEDDVVVEALKSASKEDLTWGAMADASEMYPQDVNKFHCDVCNVSVNSQDILDIHRQGKSHNKKMNQGVGSNGSRAEITTEVSNNLRCEVCNVQVTSQEMLNSHLQGKNHKKKVGQAAGSNGNAVQNFRCDVCNVTTSDQNGLGMHLQGSKHKKMMNKMQ